jgi:hypothetical protein
VAYTYKIVPFTIPPAQRASIMESLAASAAEMERIVNQWAASGWEFMGIEKMQLADLAKHYDVLVFRAGQ